MLLIYYIIQRVIFIIATDITTLETLSFMFINMAIDEITDRVIAIHKQNLNLSWRVRVEREG